MITLSVLCATLPIEVSLVERWVGLALVRPEVSPTGMLFRDIDVARVRLICELEGMGIDDEALPVVMSLLDQLYATRDQLRRIARVLESELPADVRDNLISRL